MMEGVWILIQIRNERTWNTDLNEGWKELEFCFKSRMEGDEILI